MNCQQCQRRILAADQLDAPAVAVEAHLAECEACRQFRNELSRIEANVRHVPVPMSKGKEQLKNLILAVPGTASAGTARAHPLYKADSSILLARMAGAHHLPEVGKRNGEESAASLPWETRLQRIPKRVVAAASAAAALILCGAWLGIWWAGSAPVETVSNDRAKTGADLDSKRQANADAPARTTVAVAEKSLAAKLLECDLKLAEAQKARQRIEALIELADAIQAESRMLARTASAVRLESLTSLYDRVLEQGIASQARELPMAERKQVLAVAAEQAAKKRLQSSGALTGVSGRERLRQLESDLDMVETLVDGGLNLAAEDDPLRRADYCNRLVDGVAREIKKAVHQKDATRVAQLGDQMQKLLIRGVAGNLNLARASMTPNSPRNTEIARLGAEVAGVTKAFEDDLNGDPALDPEIMGSTLQGVVNARTEVDRAVQGSSAKGKLKKAR